MSLGPAQVTVPDVVGLPQATAEAAIVAAGLSVGGGDDGEQRDGAGGRCDQSEPGGGCLGGRAGQAVDLVVSLGPAQVTVPDVVGLCAGECRGGDRGGQPERRWR